MTTDDIESLTGPALSAAVAKEVMGWTTTDDSAWWWRWNDKAHQQRPHYGKLDWQPHDKIDQAREVIKEIQRRGLVYQLLQELKKGFYTGIAYEEYLLTCPPADICRAALRVVREATQ